MTSRSKELNRFHRLNGKIRLLNADIYFLKQCKRQKVFPKFIKVDINPNGKFSDKINYAAKLKWLNLEIKYQYSKRSSLELELYKLHLKLTKNLNNTEHEQWCNFHRRVAEVSEHKYRSKIIKLDKKINKLCPQIRNKICTMKETLVVNESSETFNTEEINLLNKGLKYCLPSSSTTMVEIVAGIETSIKGFNDDVKSFVRGACSARISRENLRQRKQVSSNNEFNIIKSLRSKDCFYLKADKGNKLVILDKTEYFERVRSLITQGPYKQLNRNPLPKMIRETKDAIKSCPKLITPSLKFRLNVSNPVVPRMYCLPKIHKPGKSMRPIVSGINSPTYLLSKWLVDEFKNLPLNSDSFSVENSLEFINKIKDHTLMEEEVFVSFDVSSLFPSVPIPETLKYLADLLKKNNIETDKIDEYINLTKLCMSHNCFQIEGNYFEQQYGTSMGNCLSPFIANLFMSNFEMEFKREAKYFPRVWIRYVDDIFAIFDIKNIDLNTFLDQLNSKHPSIKFTLEKETKNSLPFLDTLVIRSNNKIEIDIYRKETNVNRFITMDSNHCFQHKTAAFNFLIHRLLSFPLSKDRYEKELKLIKDIAEYNGFSREIVGNLIRKLKFKNDVRNSTSLLPDTSQQSKFVKLPFDVATKNLNSIFKAQNLKVAYKSSNSLRNLLGNTKDKIQVDQKSGIYEIKCPVCDLKYVGQTRRPISTRYKEHIAHFRFNRPEKSSVARHISETGHGIPPENLRLVKEVCDYRELDAYESIFIHKNSNNSLNSDKGLIPNSCLFKLLDK